MKEKTEKLAKLLKEIQGEFEATASKKLKEHGFEPDLEWVVGPDKSMVQAGPCADQSGCTGRCKPDICLGKGICEAKHICGYRCRIVGDPCMAQCSSLCYSQPV